jgi:hypothetical protein
VRTSTFEFKLDPPHPHLSFHCHKNVMDNQQPWQSGRFGEIFAAWDLRLTRSSIYQQYYVVQRPGTAGKLESWES